MTVRWLLNTQKIKMFYLWSDSSTTVQVPSWCTEACPNGFLFEWIWRWRNGQMVPSPAWAVCPPHTQTKTQWRWVKLNSNRPQKQENKASIEKSNKNFISPLEKKLKRIFKALDKKNYVSIWSVGFPLLIRVYYRLLLHQGLKQCKWLIWTISQTITSTLVFFSLSVSLKDRGKIWYNILISTWALNYKNNSWILGCLHESAILYMLCLPIICHWLQHRLGLVLRF